MSEERFNTIDRRFDELDKRFTVRFNGVDKRLDGLETGQKALQTDVGNLRTELNTKITDLGQQMRILHEDTIARIAAIAPHPFATQADVGKVNTRVDDLINQRVVPLETAMRTLSRGRGTKDG